ncbi:putative RNA-binding protein Luc7-like 2 isoform X1 [Acanthaster planci]|uniref:RNA-binding protein Luc7-like 2 isoform X1 n=2 Tax=Acanthaster planci TaxID=133434 RepID=A0A8B7YGU8_ACAPL|nr:putative RNA-binding protein Luc7-like 2 isoform X1 [Acanthaster planci]
MSAQEQMRKMLDELMGTSRNGEEEAINHVSFESPQVCRAFLLNACPHDILEGTRMDLGACSKIHDPALRADYENASQRREFGYDVDAMQQLSAFIAECDHRTEIAKKRLAETQESLSQEVNTKANRVHLLAEEIGKKLAEAEALGEKGDVEESMKIMAEVEEIKKKKYEAEEEYKNSMPASTYQQQKLRVCEVCSAYLGLQDNDRRLADHFGGKLHLGFIEIREKLQDLRTRVAEKKEAYEAERAERRKTQEQERLEREREREKERRERRRRSRSRSRSRSRTTRQRSRSRSRRHSRSRSKDRRRRSRSRSRDRRRRSRSRDRDRRRRSRSRDRDRRRRSRSRDRDRDRRRRSRSRSRSRRSRSRERRRDRDERDRRRRSRSESGDRKSRSKSEKAESSPIPLETADADELSVPPPTKESPSAVSQNGVESSPQKENVAMEEGETSDSP